MDFLSAVSHTIRTHRLLEPGGRPLVALSGGGDSVALLLSLQRLGFAVEAAHCNFHLRGEESDRDEAFCRALCQRLGVTLHVCHFDTAGEARAHGESIEMAARRLRYGWFAGLVRERALTAVAVGHHRDDNVETLLLNLVRGTGIHGVTGMAYSRDGIVRPLLDVSHNDILDFLKDEGQDYVTDSTNADVRYKRNLVRHEVLPLLRRLNPSVDETLVEDMRKLQAAEEAYDAVAATLFTQYARPVAHGYTFDLAALSYAALYNAIGHAFGFPEATMRDIRRHGAGSGRAVYESADWLAAVYRGQLEVCRRPLQTAPLPLPVGGHVSTPDGQRLSLRLMAREELTEIPREAQTAALDYDRIEGTPVLRPVRQGERFVPFGMKGSKLVSDFLTDCHVSQLGRLWTRAVADDRGILWLVGHRPDSRAAITDTTRRVLLITTENNTTPKI